MISDRGCFGFHCLIGTLGQQGVNLGSAARGFRFTALTVMGIREINPSAFL